MPFFCGTMQDLVSIRGKNLDDVTNASILGHSRIRIGFDAVLRAYSGTNNANNANIRYEMDSV